MGMPPSVTQSLSAPPQSSIPLPSSPTIISIQDPTPDPLEQRVKAVKIEASAIADSLLLSLRSLETATATSVIAVAKVLKEFKPVSVLFRFGQDERREQLTVFSL